MMLTNTSHFETIYPYEWYDINPASSKILDIISLTPITGVEISEKIKNYFPISKATLMRELAFLKIQNLLRLKEMEKYHIHLFTRAL